jgi:hypothetical protein
MAWASVIEVWSDPSMLFAVRANAVVVECAIESHVNDILLTQGSQVLMTISIVGDNGQSLRTAKIGAAKGVEKENFRSTCPVGKKLEVWYDKRYPSLATFHWWSMAPFTALLFSFPLAVVVFRVFKPKSQSEEEFRNAKE